MSSDASSPWEKSPNRPEKPPISVIVPTRDRPKPLARCLEALSAQTVAAWLEIVVVDDGSSTPDEVGDVVARNPRARLLRLAGGGPAAARNAGVMSARGALLCFTDDDCEPKRDWAERLVAALQEGADAAAGFTLSGGGRLAVASEIIAHAPAAMPAAPGELSFAPSNNLACTRAAFEAVQFDESYPAAAGEDRDWCARLRAAGYVLRLEPRACLVHNQELTLRRFVRQQLRYGQGAFRFRRGGLVQRPLEGAAFYTALLRRAYAHSLAVGLLVCLAQIATAAGFILAWAAQPRRRRPSSASTASAPTASRADES